MKTVTFVLPEYILPFAIHLLAHRLPTLDDVDTLINIGRLVVIAVAVVRSLGAK